jgi:phage terminase large subunit GpA-like protein
MNAILSPPPTTRPRGDRLFLRSLAQAIRPKAPLTVSQWADAHRELSAKGSSERGRWKTTRTPFLAEIMDCLSDRSPVKRVTVMKATQLGATEVALNWIGYTISHTPGPMLVVVPTLDVLNRWVMQRLDPMLRETPLIAEVFDAFRSRAAANSKDIKDFPGGMLVLSGANSPASLSSMPMQYVVCDEVDRFPWEVGDEGDPLGLIDQRTATFPMRKVLLISTPTMKDASRIEEEYSKSDQRRYMVPCPHCGAMQWLKWDNLQWDKPFRQVWYVCESSGCVIEEHSKPAMLAAGEWVPQRQDADPTRRGYHISGLYAPIGLGYSWHELVARWLDAQGDPAKLKRFVNTSIGETWEDRSRDIKPHTLAARVEPPELRMIPSGCLLLTAGIDTQDDRLAVQIVGWGRGLRAWIIDYLEIPGDPHQDPLWMRLSEILHTPYTNTRGRDLRIRCAAIDSGGHHTHAVYNYVRGASRGDGGYSPHGLTVMAIKGANTPSKPVLSGRPAHLDINFRGRVIRNGVQLWTVGVDTVKHNLFGRLSGDSEIPPEDRALRFPSGLDEEYFRMLTAEVFNPERNRWEIRRGRRNEALDTWVYAFAATHHPSLRAHAWRTREWQKLAEQLEPESGDLFAGLEPSEGRPAAPAPATDRPKPARHRVSSSIL